MKEAEKVLAGIQNICYNGYVGHHLGYRETVRKYCNVTNGQELNYLHKVQRWERICLEAEAKGIMKKKN